VARAFKPEGLTFGVLLVALGVAWTASNLGRLDLLTTLRTWWPASLILWGALELLAWAMARPGGER
jgi:hypothetical protein